MKTIPTIAMMFALALSLPACTTTTSHSPAVKSSASAGNSLPKVEPAFHQLERDGVPQPISVSADNDVPTLEESTTDPQFSMRHTVVSILGQIVVACATSGYCW
ncbi:hypothetical protein SAMN05660964_01890 [Thiothrix caldifontis]|uniref:Lipoprotein n=1 Tax=Thiothrix caldifontis TaxID=525918 RepID=A0A1H4C7Z7_9GAMM|nr:hypothetical protein [Thiothrix caldifontis]SEA56212.1 hypothetical protein SAMN05660964_01890 [Thiothrix caldifontis]